MKGYESPIKAYAGEIACDTIFNNNCQRGVTESKRKILELSELEIRT